MVDVTLERQPDVTPEMQAAAVRAYEAGLAAIKAPHHTPYGWAIVCAIQAALDWQSEMRALSASEVACYHWPEDTREHKALRAAYILGAAATPKQKE